MPDRSVPKAHGREYSERFIRAGGRLIAMRAIQWADFSEIESLRVRLHHDREVSVATGIQAIEAAMALKPSVLESRRLRWQKGAWALHNLIGHPLMQMLACFRAYRWAMRVHDATVPRPKGML